MIRGDAAQKLRSKKQSCRKRAIDAIAEAGSATIVTESERMTQIIQAIPVWRAARGVFAFLSMDHEIDTFGIIGKALAESKHLAFMTILLLKRNASTPLRALPGTPLRSA